MGSACHSRRPFRQISAVLLFTFSLSALSGCTEYWWQRGQPPSVATLYKRSTENLAAAQKTYSGARSDVAPAFTEIGSNLDGLIALIQKSSDSATLTPRFEALAQNFMGLEGKLSPGSRPAYGELSAALRAFMEDNSAKKHLTFPPVGLFAARTKNFLASELSVPPPVS